MLKASLDASACRPNWIYSVAGLVGAPEKWATLLSAWQDALDKWRISRFHLSELPQLVGHERVKMCEGYFLRLLGECELDPVGAAILTAHWERPDWGRDSSPRFPTAYEQSLWFALKALAAHCQKRFPDHGVEVLCDIDGPETVLNSVFDKAQKEYPNLCGLSISTSLRQTELQCADLVAGYLRRSWVDITDNPDSTTPWGNLPKTQGKSSSSVWSLAQGFLLGRAMRLHEEGRHGDR